MIDILNNSQTISNLFTNQDLLIKTPLLIIDILYVLFALILTKQIFSYNNIVNQVTFSPVFKLLALIHTMLATLLVIGIVLFV